ncbi:MAG: hypothetical protein IKY38_06115 [Anaerotignum sp.]|nr:hypothetical protein [Anaerotignum sp.]
MRTGKIEVNGNEYLLCFSLRAVRACTERYGSVEKIFDALNDKSEVKQLDESLWLLATMMDCGARYAKEEGIENPSPLDVDALYDTIDLADMFKIKTAVVDTIASGNDRNVETEPDKKKKEKAAQQK